MSGSSWQEFLEKNFGKLLGVSIGLLLGWMVIHYGLFKTIFVIFMITVGYLMGKQLDEGESLNSILNRIFRR